MYVLITNTQTTSTGTMEAMRRALRNLARRIEEIKFEYIEAERTNNAEDMETLMNKLYVMEAFYNHHAAIVNGDAENNDFHSQEDRFIENMQNDTLHGDSSDVSEIDDFGDFTSQWKKLHDSLSTTKKEQSSECSMGLCFICFCDVREDELLLFSCGHSVCIGECGSRLPKPFCPAAACNKSIEDVFDKYQSSNNENKKRKADEVEDSSFQARMTDLRVRGVVASPAPVVPVVVAPSVPDIIVIDDSDEDDVV